MVKFIEYGYPEDKKRVVYLYNNISGILFLY